MGKGTFTPVVNAFRFYEDGTESGSTPLAAQDTDYEYTITGDTKFHLRYRIDETGAADGAATDDYRLEMSYNGGFWTGFGTYVAVDTASSLTDGAATTNRAAPNGISDPGSGSFVAGEQEEGNAVVEDHQLTASNFTEHVWALKLIYADLTTGGKIIFRVCLNAGSPGMTNNVSPIMSVVKVAAGARRIFVIS